jgi:DNA-binding response OmpR family regulator
MSARSVLVVEDDDLIASFVRRALVRLGYSVTCAATGTDALEHLAEGGVDVVLLDLTLPDMDGLDILRRIRDGGSTVSVIVLTSRSDPADRATAERWGVSRYLVKPFPLAELVELVGSIAAS